MNRTSLFLILILAVSNSIRSQTNDSVLNQSPYKVTKISEAINFDGIPDEDVWNTIEPLQLVMYQPVYGNSPTEKSVIKIAYDDEYFYASAWFHYKTPDDIRAIGKKRDYSSFSADWFVLTLDTYNDNQNAVTFIVNPNGSRGESTIKNDLVNLATDYNFSWNTFWDAKTKLSSDVWTSEIRIPFSSLRFQLNNNKTKMGLIISRYIAAKYETDTWPPVSPKFNFSNYKPSLARTIEFNNLDPKMRVYVTPYATAGIGQQNKLDENHNSYDTHSTFKKDAGLDIKYSVSTNTTLDLTINTDFAQVEADNQRINLSRSSLYFPEKRVFFLEKADVFDFPLGGKNNLFYSRRIGLYNGNPVRIYGGVRLTGRYKKWDFGILDMQTADFRDNPSENFGAFRLKRTVFNTYSYIGGMITSRIGTDGSYNYAYGVDANVRVKRDNYLLLKWAQTFEDQIEAGFMNPHPGRFRIVWSRRNMIGFSYNLNYGWSGKYYNPGIGFEGRGNIHGPRAVLQYGWLYKEKKIRYHAVSFTTHNWWDTKTGNQETTKANVKWRFTSGKGSNWSVQALWSREILSRKLRLGNNQASVPEGEYTFTNYSANYSTSSRKKLTAWFYTHAGNFYDGWKWTFNASPQLKIGANFDVGLFYRFDRVNFQKRNMEFTNHIMRLNGLMTLTTKTMVSAFVQYNTAINGVIGNFRFRYNPRDGNNFYIVYDELLNTNRDRKVPQLPVSSKRTILLKYSYTFRW